MVWWLLLGVLAGALAVTIAYLSWNTIYAWIQAIKNEIPNAKIAEIVKVSIGSNRCRVHAGVFAPVFLGMGEKPVAAHTWDEVEELDPVAQNKLDYGVPVRMRI